VDILLVLLRMFDGKIQAYTHMKLISVWHAQYVHNRT
jgi:hypothetical protein